MSERIRLVIWDLDETFWNGTLTEGGFSYRKDTHDIVIKLAHRGIMSSICSKNDIEAVEPILRNSGIWDYFIFPSINWKPKGSRIRDMIDVIGLRPETVMFIDDNPMNLNEALYFVPNLQIFPETIIPNILDSQIFTGKDDLNLTRLAQYKVLERRRIDEIAAGDDNRDFLRAGNIQVRIDHDIEKNIDRVIELVNRTNQLNFTKRRLPEDPMQARAEVMRMFSSFMVQAGLVHVKDNYGDYGFCGFYAVNAVSNEMLHYCFSCRILNMGVEHWMYERLGRPRMSVVGEVLTDLFEPSQPVDWINAETGGPDSDSDANQPRFGTIMLRGGCELQAIAHYLGLAAERVEGEYFEIRHGLPMRIDHSAFVRYAVEGLAPAAIEAVKPLGYRTADFHSRLIIDDNIADLYLFSFWQNASHALYHHNTLDIEVPFTIPNTDNALNAFDLSPEFLESILIEPFARDAMEYLRRNFYRTGVASAQSLQEDVSRLLDLLPQHKPVFILLQKETWTKPDAQATPIAHHIWTNNALREACAGRNNVFLIGVEDHMITESDAFDGVHFKRQVYFRIHQTILREATKFEKTYTGISSSFPEK